MNGDRSPKYPVATGKPSVKLEKAPDPTKDGSTDQICHCPECGARLRLATSEAADRVGRGTLVDWLPAGAGTQSPPIAALEKALPIRSLPEFRTLPVALTEADDDDVPTRVVRSAADLPAPGADARGESRSEAVLSASTRKPPVPMRQKIASDDDEAHTVRLQRIEQLASLSGARTAAETVEQSPATLVDNADADTDTEPKRPSLGVPSFMAASVPTAAVPAGVAPVSPNIAAAPPKVELPTVAPTVASLAPAGLASEFSPYSAVARPKRRGAQAFAVLGLGLGVAAVGGLAWLMYGSSTSLKRASLAATPVPVENHPVSAAAAPVAPSAVVVAEPSAEAIASAAPSAAASPEREAKLTAAARESAQPRPGQGATEARAAPRPTSDDSDGDEAKTKSPTAEGERQAKSGKAAKEVPAVEEEADGEPFDSAEASSALESAAERASACRRQSDPSGVAVVTVTFAPSGRVTTANIAGPPFVGTPTGSCIATTMRGAKVPAFSGAPVTVRKTVTIL